ncbi:hypothetical protein RvY_07440 [Ramazzottius varieornatus]|uniref:Uncharacterized protein n=1 Tax=Ramazzottius varieornatus TaxID=947166 RepID=A0A1D1V8A2_RAMVA|nr:hypothetical protein RvY_07440 [Ramazzottius varieornatus]
MGDEPKIPSDTGLKPKLRFHNVFASAHTPFARAATARRIRQKSVRLRALSSEIFFPVEKTPVSTSSPNLGPTTLALARFGARPAQIVGKAVSNPYNDFNAEAIKKATQEDPFFLHDVMSAGHFLGQVQSFLLSLVPFFIDICSSEPVVRHRGRN